MARLESQRLPADVTSPPNGTGAPASKPSLAHAAAFRDHHPSHGLRGVASRPHLLPSARYCALCGRPPGPGASAIDRFGDAFCSEAHAEEFVQTVRAARVQAAVHAKTAVEGPGGPTAGAVSQRDWKAVFGKTLCWGAPLLVVALVLAGGTGALVGWAGAALPFLAALACPLGMYFMMRGMSKMGDHGDSKDKPEGR